MGFAGFGLGLNSMMQGLQNGLQLGKQIKDYRKESNIEEAKSQSLDEAKAVQEADKAAGHDGTPLMDYYMKVAAPRVREAYLQNGDIEGAAGEDSERIFVSSLPIALSMTQPRVIQLSIIHPLP
jgi:hypothetical protein